MNEATKDALCEFSSATTELVLWLGVPGLTAVTTAALKKRVLAANKGLKEAIAKDETEVSF